MAGIGFELRKILKEDTILSYFKAFFNSLVFISGPWIISMFNLIILFFLIGEEIRDYYVIITHALAYSLICTAPFQNIIIRYVADVEFSKNESKIFPALIGGIIFISVVGIIPMILFYYFMVDMSIGFRISVLSFFYTNLIFWIVFGFISLLRNYKKMTFYYLISLLTASFLIFLFKGILEIFFVLYIYSIAYLCIISIIIYYVYKTYPSDEFMDFSFLRCVKKYYIVLIQGFIFYLAVWVDKFIFWIFAPGSETVFGFFKFNFDYDLPFFISSISIIPILSVFTIVIETSIAENFHEFINGIINKKSISRIIEYKDELIKSINKGYELILKYQIFFCLILMFYSTYLFKYITHLHVLKILLVGGVNMALFIYQSTILHYMDAGKELLKSTVIFFILNLILSYFTCLDIRLWGTGYTVSLIIVNILIYFDIDHIVKRMDYVMYNRENQ